MFRAQQNAFDDAVGESCLEVLLDLFGDPPLLVASWTLWQAARDSLDGGACGPILTRHLFYSQGDR